MKRRYPKRYIEELEKAILTEIVRTRRCRESLSAGDREEGRKSAETLLALAQVWDLRTKRGVE